MLKLSKTQEKIVQQKNMGTFVITGEVHSGKTSVATLRMLYLLEHGCKAGDRVLYVCYNEEERARVSKQFNEYYGLQNISLFDEEAKGEAVIKEVEDLIEEAANKAHVHLNLALCEKMPESIIEATLPQVRKAYPKVKWLKPSFVSFIQHELGWINTCGYTTFKAYAASARKGAEIKLPKKGSGRKAIWLLKELTSSMLKKEGFMTKDQVQIDTLCYLQEDALRERYKHIIIDDAQRLTKVQIECIKALKSEEQGEVLFIMDKKEVPMPFAWLGNGNTFKTIGLDMTGRVKNLVSKKKAHSSKKRIEMVQTPLELFMNELAHKKQEEGTKQVSNKTNLAPEEKKEALRVNGTKLLEETKAPVVSKLPWYVETYRYINKITGVETVFQRDSSAGETYIDELKQDDVDEIPIYSDIAAGMPIELVDEVNGKFELPSDLLHHKRNTYILHVQGDSMTGVNISDGDYVVIQAGNVNNHEIAAVYYNGATTLKRIVQEEEHILLVSENPKYKPIVIEEGDFRVMGKLIGVIKPL